MEERTCPWCEHDFGRHEWPDGCFANWRFDNNGVTTHEGCQCKLAHGDYSPERAR